MCHRYRYEQTVEDAIKQFGVDDAVECLAKYKTDPVSQGFSIDEENENG